MWGRKQQNTHVHTWCIVAVDTFDYNGKTRMLHRCMSTNCQKVYVDAVDGDWTMEQICGYGVEDVPADLLMSKEALQELASWTNDSSST